jgi:hypothetical protein
MVSSVTSTADRLEKDAVLRCTVSGDILVPLHRAIGAKPVSLAMLL